MATKTRLLPRQRAFCAKVAEGMTPTAAARLAGYSLARAASTASRLMTRPEIAAGIQRRRDGYDPSPVFDDVLQFLMWSATDPEGGASAVRVAAAIATLPYLYRRRTSTAAPRHPQSQPKRAARR